MLASAIVVVAASLIAAIALGAFSSSGTSNAANNGAGGSAAAQPDGNASPTASGGATQSQPSNVCVSNQNCSRGLPYAQPDFLAVAMPKLEADLHKTEAQIVGAMNNGSTPTALAAQVGLSRVGWYQDESDAFAAGFDALHSNVKTS